MSNNLDDCEAMDLDKDEGTDNKSCSICLDPVIDHADRSIARLHCGHEFHLDCIGSAFNAKGSMQCPNCRKVEKGRWLFANGHRPPAVDFDFDAWMSSDELYDFSYSELPFGFQWCPFQGLTQLASLFEEGESQLNSYHEPVSSSTYGEHQNASSNTHVCPYLALHGNPHTMQTAAPSSSTDSESIGFPRQSNVLGPQLPSNNDIMNSHNFPNSEPQNQNWRHAPHSHVFIGNAAEQSATQFGPRSSRDAANQPRPGSFAHPRRLVHVSVPVSGSNVVNPTVGEHRSHAPHAHSHSSSGGGGNNNNYHMYHQHSVPSSIRSAQFTHPPPPPVPARRSRPRVAPHIPPPSSSSSSSSSSNEVGGFYSFAPVSNSTVPGPHHHPDETMAHHNLYGRGGGRGRERLNPSLPWIPLEGEAQWWGPFNPNPGPQAGGGGGRSENGYQRMPAPPGPRMPPPPYM